MYLDSESFNPFPICTWNTSRKYAIAISLAKKPFQNVYVHGTPASVPADETKRPYVQSLRIKPMVPLGQNRTQSLLFSDSRPRVRFRKCRFSPMMPMLVMK